MLKLCMIAGKGGTGKTTVACNLALALRDLHKNVGLVDLDLTAPNILRALGTNKAMKVNVAGVKWIPIEDSGLKIVSMASIIENGKAFLWAGDKRKDIVKEFAESTDWSDVDILVLDLPPGTDESTTGMIEHFKPDGAVIVTNPHPLAYEDYLRVVDLLELYRVPILKVVVNMAYFKPRCPHKGCKYKYHRYEIFGDGKTNFKKAYEIPLDPEIAKTNRVDLSDLAKEILSRLVIA